MKLYGDEKIFDLTLSDGTKTKALGFWGVESTFSNFHPCNIVFDVNGEESSVETSEQVFMMFKAIEFDDIDSLCEIIEAPNPMMAKSIGRSVKNYDDNVWKEKRESAMFMSLEMKFTQNEDMKKRLLETGDMYLVEASPYDSIWGVKLGVNDSRILSQDKWRGDNLLGEALMKVREKILDYQK